MPKGRENEPSVRSRSRRYRGILRKAEEEHGLTTQEIGQLIGASAESVYRWKTGKQVPKSLRIRRGLDELAKLAKLMTDGKPIERRTNGPLGAEPRVMTLPVGPTTPPAAYPVAEVEPVLDLQPKARLALLTLPPGWALAILDTKSHKVRMIQPT